MAIPDGIIPSKYLEGSRPGGYGSRHAYTDDAPAVRHGGEVDSSGVYRKSLCGLAVVPATNDDGSRRIFPITGCRSCLRTVNAIEKHSRETRIIQRPSRK